jgi:hypothetical protein
MDTRRFDRIAQLFANRRSRPRLPATSRSGSPIVSLETVTPSTQETNAAEHPTPSVEKTTPISAEKQTFLFLQSFQAGSITPSEEDGVYTLTLEHGLGQTIYFGDRPSREVGAVPTPAFLDGFDFQPENPPNAALVIDAGDGETDVAVFTLANPVVDEAGPTITYDATLLADYENSATLGVTNQPTDPMTIPASFGHAHLFIDDCPDKDIFCRAGVKGQPGLYLLQTNGPLCWSPFWTACLPCREEELKRQCNERFPNECRGECTVETKCGPCWW